MGNVDPLDFYPSKDPEGYGAILDSVENDHRNIKLYAGSIIRHVGQLGGLRREFYTRAEHEMEQAELVLMDALNKVREARKLYKSPILLVAAE